jgi:hypothetical protein
MQANANANAYAYATSISREVNFMWRLSSV